MGSHNGLKERPGVPIGERMSELNPQCLDVDSGETVWPEKFVKKMLATETDALAFDKCEDIFDKCNWDNSTGISARKWCPQTCGCNAANSSLILSREDMGCPSVCFVGYKYQSSRKDAVCEDQPSNSSAFMSYISGLRSLQASYRHQSEWYAMFGNWIANLAADGCNATKLATSSGASMGDLCTENTWKLKPVHNLCPKTCGCHLVGGTSPAVPTGQSPLCPLSCSENLPSLSSTQLAQLSQLLR